VRLKDGTKNPDTKRFPKSKRMSKERWAMKQGFLIKFDGFKCPMLDPVIPIQAINNPTFQTIPPNPSFPFQDVKWCSI
jgi:hypothetical protein